MIYTGPALEMLRRYRHAFGRAWKSRAQFRSRQYEQDELEFLPARLELVETPVSPAVRWTVRVLAALICVGFIWAVVGRMDIVAVAAGKTIVGVGTKVVQAPEAAIVRRILVHDGSDVKQGDLLVELDDTATSAEARQAEQSLLSAHMAEIRSSVILRALHGGAYPALEDFTDLPSDSSQQQLQIAISSLAEYGAEQENLRAVVRRSLAAENTARSQIDPLRRSLDLSRERVADLEKALGGQYVSKHEYLARAQEAVENERLLIAQQASLAELNAALTGAREELRAHEEGVRAKVLDELRQAQEQVAQYGPQAKKTQNRDRFMQVRAPVDGTVQQMALYTIGGVVTAAQSLMVIVPSREKLEVEATILNKDIGFVKPNQRASVKIQSFPYTRYGYIEATLESISHDAAQDDDLGLVYPARLKLASDSIVVDGTRVYLAPGMNVTVEIKTGKRQVIDYFLGPLRENAGESMREN